MKTFHYARKTVGSRIVIDERCSCTHPMTEHRPRYVDGHGSCLHCPCKQFTWIEFVYEEERGTT